jgi:hypothetical protein
MESNPMPSKTGPKPPASPSPETLAVVYLLADHLDAALAAGEDLLACRFDLGSTRAALDTAAAQVALADRREFQSSISSLEMTIVSRLVRAREQSSRLAELDQRFGLTISMLVSGTHAVAEEVAGAATPGELAGGADELAYWRNRGVIGPDTPSLAGLAEIRPGESFLVLGRIALGAVLDHVAAMLDALELHYELFDAADLAAARVGSLGVRAAA